MKPFHFTKMQGLGNDFVLVEGPAGFTPDEVDRICDRRLGIGADGILVVSKGDPVRMEYWNADGSAAEMCGNGLRCVARYVYDRGWVDRGDFTVHTPIGLRGVRVLDDRIEAELGRPGLLGSRSLRGADYTIVDMGNPHAVTFVDDPRLVDVASIGTSLQTEFEGGANVEFAARRGSGVEMRVWERGVGETVACGTGMAAVAAVARERFDLANPVTVSVPGGQASIDFRDGVAWIVGPAEYSFAGTFDAS